MVTFSKSPYNVLLQYGHYNVTTVSLQRHYVTTTIIEKRGPWGKLFGPKTVEIALKQLLRRGGLWGVFYFGSKNG